MKSIKLILVIFIILIFNGNSLFAQGESAVPFLLIAPGARACGMGEAGVALANDATAVFWNPAGLAFQYDDQSKDKRGEISLMHVKWLPQFNFDDLWYDFLSGSYYLEDIGTVGGSITYLNLGENVWTDRDGNELGTFDSFEYAITGSYATKLKDNLSVGVNLKFIHSRLSEEYVDVGGETREGVSSSFAIDLGVLWKPAYDFFDNRVSFGANLSNFGPKMTYINEAQADPLPTNIRLGLAYEVLNDGFNKMTLIYDTNRMLVVRDKEGSDNVFEAVFYSAWVKGSFSDRLRKFNHSFGLEYWYRDLFAVRGGYFHEDYEKGNRKYYTMGLGLRYNVFGIDFAYLVPQKREHPLAETLRFTLHFDFYDTKQLESINDEDTN